MVQERTDSKRITGEQEKRAGIVIQNVGKIKA